MYRGDFHFIEKANGIKYLYASVIRHPDVRPVVSHPRIVSGVVRLWSLSQKVVWPENIASNLRQLPGLHHWNAAKCRSFFKCEMRSRLVLEIAILAPFELFSLPCSRPGITFGD